ncbi:copper resistance CopC family protein [Domibacillus robiginosus]|uniref:copper resistance CopC family protein n=1 Tax=Domibacillus robiginosus TaxID=1071054 RepID=UPI00067DA987|nr:copper resistance CopC family protein [Domibacillus robiginosus]
MKKSVYIFFFLLLTFSSSVSAHTGMKSASPADGETISGDIQEIKVEFNTAIESGSSMSLLNENGNEIDLDSSQVEEKTLVGKVDEPLQDDHYTVKWRIVGEDGHLIEGDYMFMVQHSNKNNEDSKTADELGKKNNQAADTEETLKESTPASAADNAQEKISSSSIIISLVIGIILFFALPITMWLIQKGRGK